MVIKTHTVTRTVEEEVMFCDFCGKEIDSRYGRGQTCGAETYYVCIVCDKHMCPKCCAGGVLFEEKPMMVMGGAYFVDFCRDHATQEIIDKVKDFKTARDRMRSEALILEEKLFEDLLNWLHSKR